MEGPYGYKEKEKNLAAPVYSHPLQFARHEGEAVLDHPGETKHSKTNG